MLINYAFYSPDIAQALFMDPVHVYDHYTYPESVLRCPATQDYAKNLYAIPFPYDLEIKFRMNHGYVDYEYLSMDKSLIHDKLLHIRDGRHAKESEETKNIFDIQYTGIDYMFWSDQNVKIETWGADIPNLTKLPATFDIKKWIRGIHPAYLIPNNTDIHIKYNRGDPYMFVRFNTDKKVKLKYNNDRTIVEDALKMAKSTTYVSKLRKFFDRFEKIRPRRLTK